MAIMKNKLAFVLVAVLVSAGLLSVAGNAAADTRAYANQAPEEEWNRTFGGLYEDYGLSVQQTSDGGYIIAGYTSSYGAGYYNEAIKAFKNRKLFKIGNYANA